MALNNQTDMDFTPQYPLSTASNVTAPTPCEELTSMKIYIRRLQIICNEKRTVSLLRQDKGHDEGDSLYQLAWNEYQDVQSSLQQAVSDFDSLPPCTKPGCSHHISPKSTPKNSPHLLPLGETTNKNEKMRMILNSLHSEKLHVKQSCRNLKKLESKTNTPYSPMDTLKKADLEDIKKDLENEGFEPERVTQLIGRRTKQKLPIFQVTLPRTIENLKIFDLKTLAHLNITVDGYNGRGVTQCFSCNNFHHNADNCYLKPRCLKCGEEHLTKDCPIKQRLETKFCINCQVYGHMANWYGCPCFPKPPKGTTKVNRNSYTNLYNSLIRPNFSYAQATSEKPAIKNKNQQQMAPRRPETSRQTETVI
ncbi:uncharacterized protein TNCV_2557701 [Trichonephila clavipes]|nr:uncharacterized protein TNCV_2557701 [Trichonephila clavipes]